MKEVPESLADCQKAIELEEQLVAANPNVLRYQHNLAASYFAFADLKRSAGQLAEATVDYEKSIEIAERLVTENPEVLEYRNLLAAASNNFAALSSFQGDFEKAIEYAQKIIELQEQLVARNPADREFRSSLTLYTRNLGIAFNKLAWRLVTCPDPDERKPDQAVELAKKAVELCPNNVNCWNTLGTAQYRAGHWKPSAIAFEEVRRLGKTPTFILAMAQWQLGEKETVRRSFQETLDEVNKDFPDDQQLRGMQAEAEKLMGITEQQQTEAAPASPDAKAAESEGFPSKSAAEERKGEDKERS